MSTQEAETPPIDVTAPTPGMELERIARAHEVDVTDQRIIDRWDARQKSLIARTVAQGASGEELHLFLGVAARYNLDPFQGEIWCVKTPGRNGGEGKIAIIVGEQGRLKIANRYPDYRGFSADVVCTEDRFMKLKDPKEIPGVAGQFTYIEHSYGHPKERGEIVGAWCEVYREGRPPVYFFAPWGEYFPADASERAQKFIPWFKTGSRMIDKCAISTAFRMAFNLAGIYGPEEMDHVLARTAGEDGGATAEPEIEWGTTDEIAERMQSLFAAANNAKQGAYPPAKIRLKLAGLTDDERYSLAAKELIPFIRAHGGTVPEPGESVVDDSEVEVETDAETEPVMGADEGEPDDSQEEIPGT